MDWFYEQSEHTHPITEEELRNITIKNYYSGRLIQVGDMVFHGFLKEQDGDETKYTLIKFHREEINTVYKTIDNPKTPDSNFPTLKKISKT